MYLAAARGKIDMAPHATRETSSVFPMLIFPLHYALSNPHTTHHTHIYIQWTTLPVKDPKASFFQH